MNINIKSFTDEIVKLASEDKPTYPFSRGSETYDNINSYGLRGYMLNRALQGRKNLEEKGLTTNEDKILDVLLKEKGNSTYPISRTLTDPVAMGMYGGASGILGGIVARNLPLAVVLGIAGAGSAAAGTYLTRGIHARALIGRARKDRDGWGQRERGILHQLRNKEI
jgi:hypothetical protein